jgi:hypothetical protein
MRFAAQLSAGTSYGWLLFASSFAALVFILYSVRRGWLRASLWALIFSIWFTLLIHEVRLAPALARYQPVERLAQSIPAGARVYTSFAANDWANTLAFHLPAGRRVTRLDLDRDAVRLREILLGEPGAVVLMKEEEARPLMESGIPLRVLAAGETFGHGGLTLNTLRRPVRGRLLMVEAGTKFDGK